MVLNLDSAAGHVAARLRLACSLGHALCLLFVLERAAFRFAMAQRTLDARSHRHSAACRGFDFGAAEKREHKRL